MVRKVFRCPGRFTAPPPIQFYELIMSNYILKSFKSQYDWSEAHGLLDNRQPRHYTIEDNFPFERRRFAVSLGRFFFLQKNSPVIPDRAEKRVLSHENR